MDALADILRHLRLKSCLYFRHQFSPPWGMSMDRASVAQFHLIVSGDCLLVKREHDQRVLPLSAGDIVIFPRGSAHDLVENLQSPRRSGREVMQAFHEGKGLFNNGPATVEIICGHFEFSEPEQHPFLSSLPDCIHVEAGLLKSRSTVGTLANLLADEMVGGGPGDDLVAERLAEALFVEALRAYYRQARPVKGFLAALHDPRIGRAINLIHADAPEPVSLTDLAERAGMSRTAFTDRFKTLTGTSPMAYAEYWRLGKARSRIEQGGESLAKIAAHTGYQSTASFHRAFKRFFGVTPGALRRSS